MRIRNTIISFLGAVAVALPSLALADHHKEKSADIPQPKSAAGGFEYVSGGVGEVEAAAMESAYADYSFKLVNVRSGPEATYVSDVAVTITKSDGNTVLETTTKGPWLLADMPAGTYDIEASFDGSTHSRTLTLEQGADQRLVWDWRTR